MESIFQDVCYTLRQLRRSPGFTAVAVLTLALGIGANTGIFTLVNAVLLKSLPVPDPEQLVLVTEGDWRPQNTRFSYPMFQTSRASMPSGSELAAISWPVSFYASFGGGQPEMVTGQLVSGNYFQTLGTRAALGRLLYESDDRIPGGRPVAVISYGCWERRFGRDPNVIGRKLVVNGMPLQVVGVAVQGFFGAQVGTAPEFWMPTTMQAAVRYAQHYSQGEAANIDKPWVEQSDIRWLQFVIRARGPKAVSQASAALNQVFHLNREQSVASIKDPQEREAVLRSHLQLVPGGRGLPTLREGFSRPLLALMAVVGIILLIACANLANLLLARAAAREREIAVRLSIGASRARLVRQLLVECTLLSISGTMLGSVVAYWLTDILPKWASSGSAPIPLSLTPDARVLFFSAAIAVFTAIAFGLAPALQGTRVEPIQALKAGGRAIPTGTGARWSLKQTLVALQVALSLVLLVGAGLFVRTLRNFTHLDPGFDRDHLVSVELDTHLVGYSQPQLSSLYRRLIERVEALPGVRSASLVSCELASGCGDASDIYLPGVPHSSGETDAQERRVSQDFFATTGIPLLEGRSFADSDTINSPQVAVVNQAFVRQFLHGKDPLGQYYGYDAANPYRFQIVGIVKDSRVNDIREDAPPTIYHSLSQDVIDVESLNVRTFGDPAQLIAATREAVRSVDPNLPIGDSSTVAVTVSDSLAQQRLIAQLTSIFGGLALGLACLGLYGVMSYTVAYRTSELGIRLALGSSRHSVLWLVMRQSIALGAAGIAGGLLLSFLSAHAVRSLLFGLGPYDPVTMFMAAAVLFGVSLASGLMPAWRASKVDPMVALRYE
jgi:putative ABC transport system permease protein